MRALVFTAVLGLNIHNAQHSHGWWLALSLAAALASLLVVFHELGRMGAWRR